MSKLSDRRKEVREYTTEQADQELQRLRRQLFDLRIQQQRGEVKNNRQFSQVRTDIARLMYQLDLLALAEEEAALEEAEELVEELEEEAEAEEAEGGDDDGDADDDDSDDDDDGDDEQEDETVSEAEGSDSSESDDEEEA